MPTRPPHPCPRCGTLVTGRRYCPPCTTATHRARDQQRGNFRQRGYDADYERSRRQLLANQPPCHWCGTPDATVADHLVPLSAGGTNQLANLVPSCTSCNARRITR